MTRTRSIVLLKISLASSVLFAQPYPPGFPLGARIPEITGSVVDAVTGKPLADIDVTLRATSLTASFGDGGSEPLRYENSRTTARGQFAFRASLEKQVDGPLTSMKGYWLTVNLGFLTAEELKKDQPYSDPKMDFLPDDLSYLITAAAFSRPRYPNRPNAGGGRRWSNPAYFPMAVQFVRPCDQVWNANCLYSQTTRKLRIALIPILDNPADCLRIADGTLGEQCRQLNAYWAAFLHTDTVEQFQKDKELCEGIDHGAVTKSCLDNLRTLDRDLFEGHWTEQHQIAATMVMLPVAGLTPMSLNTVRQPGQPVMYVLPYLRTDRDRGLNSCLAYVWQTPSEQERAAALETVRAWGRGAAERTQTAGGNAIQVIDFSDAGLVFWPSMDSVVALMCFNSTHYAKTFGEERAHAAEATPEMRVELMRQYLLKHPPLR